MSRWSPSATVEIAKKIDIHKSYVAGFAHLEKNGEKRLISAVEKGGIPLSVAMQIANADEDGSRANLPKTERESLARAFVDQLKPMMADLDVASEKQLREAVLDSRIEKVDLNSDGVPEVIVQGLPGCSPMGNCPFWIFQRVAHRYKLLLDGSGQTFTIQETRTNGFRDIVVAMHGSATESVLTVYRYEHGNYHDVNCYEADWSVMEGDTNRQLKEPRISPCGGQ